MSDKNTQDAVNVLKDATGSVAETVIGSQVNKVVTQKTDEAATTSSPWVAARNTLTSIFASLGGNYITAVVKKWISKI
jgi:hypothetical protein